MMPGKQTTDLYGDFIRRLVDASWTDDEIADVCGVTRVEACLARQRLGLRPAYRGRTRERCRRARQERFEACENRESAAKGRTAEEHVEHHRWILIERVIALHHGKFVEIGEESAAHYSPIQANS